jgi:hypothetical protein
MSRAEKTMLVGVRIACLAPLLLATQVAAEGSIELIAGKRAPVCQAYLAAAKKWETASLACVGDLPLSGTEISRVSDSFRKTEFSMQEDDPTLPLRASAWKFVRKYDVNEANYFYADQLMKWDASPEQRSAAMQGMRNQATKYFTDSAIRKAELDIDNDGVNDTVFFYPHCVFGGSVVSSVTMSSPLVVSQEGNGINQRTSNDIFRVAIRRSSTEQVRRRPDGTYVAVADFYTNSAFGLFRFRGKTYFDFWWDAPLSAVPNPIDANVLRVYLAEGGHARAVCAFHVEPAPALPK